MVSVTATIGSPGVAAMLSPIRKHSVATHEFIADAQIGQEVSCHLKRQGLANQTADPNPGIGDRA